MSDPLGLIPNVGAGAAQSLTPKAAGGAVEGPGFKDVLMQEIDKVSKLQQDAQTAITDLYAGRRDDFANVLMAQKKAELAFQMLLQVRNKMVDAFEEIKQIRV